jgi:hypothetical protein
MYVYKESEHYTDEHGYTQVLYTVGYYDPSGKWVSESDHDTSEKAAERVAWLNGSRPQEVAQSIQQDLGEEENEILGAGDDYPVYP